MSFSTVVATRNIGSTNQVVLRIRGDGTLEFVVAGRVRRITDADDTLRRLFTSLIAASGTIS